MKACILYVKIKQEVNTLCIIFSYFNITFDHLYIFKFSDVIRLKCTSTFSPNMQQMKVILPTTVLLSTQYIRTILQVSEPKLLDVEIRFVYYFNLKYIHINSSHVYSYGLYALARSSSLCKTGTVMILNFRTYRSRQTVQTQIRLLLEEQSDQGLHCLLFHLHLFDKHPKVLPLCLNFRLITAKFSDIQKLRDFTVAKTDIPPSKEQTDHTALMSRLICAFVIKVGLK